MTSFKHLVAKFSLLAIVYICNVRGNELLALSELHTDTTIESDVNGTQINDSTTTIPSPSESKKTIHEEDLKSFLKVLSYLIKRRQKELKDANSQPVPRKYKILKLHEEGPSLLLENRDKNEEPTLNSLLYKDSKWSPCTRSCKVRRLRKCRMPNLCMLDILVESAFCFYPDSTCEKTAKAILEESNSDKKVSGREPQKGMDEEHDYEYTKPIYRNPHYDVPSVDHYDYGEDIGHYDPYSMFNEHTDPTYTHDHFPHYNLGTPDYYYEDPSFNENDYLYEEHPYIITSRRKDVPPDTEGPDPKVNVVSATDDECGTSLVPVPHKMFRIIGGMEAVRGAWPWQVAILNRFKETFCGGTLIAPHWVITAAHCVRKKLYVRLAEHDIRIHDGEMEIKVERSFKHRGFNLETIDNDIALLKLPKNDIKAFRPSVQRACLPPSGSALPKGIQCVVLGWGKERESHIFGSDVLMYAKVPTVSRRACKRAYSEHGITENMMCAGFIGGGPDACAGDSGGPLLCQGPNKRWAIHGVTSFGDGCGEKGRLGVYVKVANYIKWINRTMEKH